MIDMKLNVQIMDKKELAIAAGCHIGNEIGRGIAYNSDSCSVDKNGTFHFRSYGNNAINSDFSPNELAEIVNMPLWEVVGIDNNGFDEMALMFYEEN